MGINFGDHYDQALAGSTFPTTSSSGAGKLIYLVGLRNIFVSQNGSSFVIGTGIPISWGASNPSVNNFLGSWNYSQNATEINTQIIVPVSGSLFGFTIRATDANFSATATFTLRKNAANTTLTGSVTNAVNNVIDTTHTTTVVRGDLLSVRITGLGVTNRIWTTVYIAPGT
jgi:hypothetical protein